jgi:hypothetical protein
MELDAPNPPGRVRTVQLPVYYISEVLHEAKTRYLEVNKLLYAVLIASLPGSCATTSRLIRSRWYLPSH